MESLDGLNSQTIEKKPLPSPKRTTENRPMQVVVILGNPSSDVTLPAALISQAMRCELDIFGTWNSVFSASGNNDDWRTVLAAADSGAIDLDCLVTHRVPLEDAFAALEMMRDQSEFFSKVLIRP